jgi:thiol-disulfide isomerase/thioredoxin
MRSLGLLLLAGALLTTAPALTAQDARPIIPEVRVLIGKDDFAGAERALNAFITDKGRTPEALEAMSWLGRGALARKRYDAARKYATETYGLALQALKGRGLDDEPRLPIALGAAIEVQAHVMAETGQRSEAVYFLQRELEEYGATSIRARINKNINLLSLVGREAPGYDTKEWIGDRQPPAIASLRGKPVLMFFWAHWCPDCKNMAKTLAELQQAYGPQGLEIVAPTQRYGYVARREPADASTEKAYIAQVAGEAFGAVSWTAPLSNDSFANYGSSTTPTIVLLDRKGIVRLYHPGQMTREQLEPHVKAIVDSTR